MPSSDDNKELPSYTILQQAAQWFAIIQDENVSLEKKLQFNTWLAKNNQHKAAWQYVEKISERFSNLTHHSENNAVHNTLTSARNDRLNRRQALQSIAVFGFLGYLACRYTPLLQSSRNYIALLHSDHGTVTGEVKRVDLADGGYIYINTTSAINIDYTVKQRTITLHNGEILITTAEDTQKRTFIVQTQYGQLEALGTHFNVYQQSESILLSVFDGAVAITTHSGATLIVSAGQQCQFTDKTIAVLQKADKARESWSRGVLVANNISLEELIGELKRYHHIYINISPEAARLRVMGRYPLNNPAQIFSMITESLPIKVNQIAPWWLNIEKT
ncbi:FecR family protein [Colwellia asteriadis]|uniref:FecR family protein n=1 Tax=Colwellia asteriadis TaxID=517723 RepID=A0ABN1L7V8_9GAMM